MTEYIKKAYVEQCMNDSFRNSGIPAEARKKFQKWLDKAPAADVRPVRHGRWLIKTIRGDKRTVCSECLLETGTCYEENYCPNCGARMDLDGDTE